MRDHEDGADEYKAQRPWHWWQCGADEEGKGTGDGGGDGMTRSPGHDCSEGGAYNEGHDADVVDLFNHVVVGIDVCEAGEEVSGCCAEEEYRQGERGGLVGLIEGKEGIEARGKEEEARETM